MPGRIRFELPKLGATEIRIHGVGGTGPDAILGDPHPKQVAGDERAGFFRPAEPNPGMAHSVEAYSWGGLTSRKATRALWILLLPFTLTNVAGWMVVRWNGGNRLSGAQERLCRVMALLATFLMIVGIAAITGDLIGVQCGRYIACRDGRWWLSLFEHKAFAEAPLRRLVVGLAPPLAVLGALAWLSRRSRKEYDEFSPRHDQTSPHKQSMEASDDTNLDSRSFWYRPSLVKDLTALHVAGSLACLCYLLATAIVELHVDQQEPVRVPSLVGTARWTSLGCVVFVMGWTFLTRRHRVETPKNRFWKIAYWLFAGAMLVLLGYITCRAWSVDYAYPKKGLQTFRRAPLYLLLGSAVLAASIAGIQMVAWLRNVSRSMATIILWIVIGGGAFLGITLNFSTSSFPVIGASIDHYLLAIGIFAAHIALLTLARWLAYLSTHKHASPRESICLIGLWIGLVTAVGLVFIFRNMEVVYAILGALGLVSLLTLSAALPKILAGAGLLTGGVALWVNEPPWIHIIAVAAILAVVLALYDHHWPRNEFRWGGPPVMALLGIVLLGAVLSGASTQVVDYLDKRQSSTELRDGVIAALDRNYQEFRFNDTILSETVLHAQTSSVPVAHNQFIKDLASIGVPEHVLGHVRTLLQYVDFRQRHRDAVIGLLQHDFESLQFNRWIHSGATREIEQAYGSGSFNAEDLVGRLTSRGVPAPVIDRIYLSAVQGDRRPVDIVLPDAYEWLTVGIAASLCLSLVAILFLYFSERISPRTPDEVRVAHDKPAGARELKPKEKKRLRGAIRAMKAIKESAGAGDLLISFIVGLIVFGVTVVLLIRLEYPISFWTWVDEPFEPDWEWLLAISKWIITALPVIGIATIRKSYSNEASRRKIGIVWDLVTFWPRRFHPLSPPSYSERAVPELQQRVLQATESGKRVVVAAHSQGSIVGYATLLPLRGDKLRRITLATYGSPLGSYYRRFFPAYFSTENYDALEKRLQAGCREHSWRNFWRPTDPIAGCVFSLQQEFLEKRDIRLHDPWWWWRFPGQPPPHLQVHSDYMDDKTLTDWIEESAEECPKCQRALADLTYPGH